MARENNVKTAAPATPETELAQMAQPDAAALAILNGGAGTGTAVARSAPTGEMSATLGGGGLALRPSYLDIAYSVSPWNENDKFGNGAFVLDHEDEIAKQTVPLTVIVAGKRTYWMTYPQNGMSRGDFRFYATEAMAARGIDVNGVQGPREITQYPAKGSGGKLPTALEAADLDLLIRRPEGCASTRFVMKLGEHWYAPAKLSVNKTWRDIAPELARACCYEAGMRNADPKDGRTDRYFMRLWTKGTKKESTDANGKPLVKTLVHLNLSFLSDDKGPVPIPETVLESLRGLAAQVAEARASSGEDAEYADTPAALPAGTESFRM
jgi:hypothetical protein